jgi:hypothetical protein
VELFVEGVTHLLPEKGIPELQVRSWDNKPIDAEDIKMWEYKITPEIMDFYNFQLIAGEMLTDADPESMVLMNESAVKLFSWHDPVGKQFENYTVKGVIKNVYNTAPTTPAKPICYSKYIPPAPPPPVKTTVDSEEVIFYIIKHRYIMFK